MQSLLDLVQALVDFYLIGLLFLLNLRPISFGRFLDLLSQFFAALGSEQQGKDRPKNCAKCKKDNFFHYCHPVL